MKKIYLTLLIGVLLIGFVSSVDYVVCDDNQEDCTSKYGLKRFGISIPLQDEEGNYYTKQELKQTAKAIRIQHKNAGGPILT